MGRLAGKRRSAGGRYLNDESQSSETVSLPIRAIAVVIQLAVGAGAGYSGAIYQSSHDVGINDRRMDRVESLVERNSKETAEQMRSLHIHLESYMDKDTAAVRANDKALGVIAETVTSCKKSLDDTASRVTYLE